MSQRRRIHPAIMEVLEACTLPWEITNGKRHYHIRVGGRLAAVVPRKVSSDNRRNLENTVADLRRAAGVTHGKR